MDHPTRRDIMLGGAALTLASTRAHARPAAQSAHETARGQVREASGAPLPRVMVSNGREIVRTDAEGRYVLPVAPGQAIFVIKPAGYQVPLDPVTRLPRFSYIHDPQGTPRSLCFRYQGMPATGPLPAAIDFTLTRVAEPEKFDVVLMTDPQPESTAEVEFVRDDIVCGLIGTDAAFGLNCGDVVSGDLSMYGRVNRIMGQTGLPFWTIGGNHDLDCQAPDARRSRDTFKSVFGATYYAFEHGRALFIMLDNVSFLGTEAETGFRAVFPPEQLAFVANLMRETPKDRLIVLAMHVPLRTHVGSGAECCTTNGADLLRLLGDRPSVSFAGHTHTTEHHYLGAPDGYVGATPHHHHVLTAASGAWWSGPADHRGIPSADSYDGTPNGYHVLSIDGTRYTTRFVAKGTDGRKQMRISLETQDSAADRPLVELLRSPIGARQAAGTRVVVNVFDGGPKTKVTCAIDGGTPLVLERVLRPDPFFVQVYERHRETIKKWVTPQASAHLFDGALPDDLGPGTYTLHVVATDEYGRRHTDGMVLEVV